MKIRVYIYSLCLYILQSGIIINHLLSTNCTVGLFVHEGSRIIKAALWNRAGHYIFALWFLLLLSFFVFSSPNLSRRRLDVYHTSTHGVAMLK